MTKITLSFMFSVFIVHLLPLVASDGLIYRTTSVEKAKRTPDIYKKTSHFLEALDYIVEAHQVTTEDGYILKMYRIPGGKFSDSNSQPPRKRVILIQHATATSSDVWVMLGTKSFPVLLSENGFDVWLSNSRGTSYSPKHLNYTADDREYWNYSFHETGMYDLRSMIDYILAETGVPSLYYVGHSRGGTDGLVLLTTRPEYNKKVRLYIGFTPTSYIKRAYSRFMQSVYRTYTAKFIENAFSNAGFYHWPINSKEAGAIFSVICGSIALNPCWFAQSFVLGSKTTLNATILPVAHSHFPQGESMKTVVHNLQIGYSDRFAQYDYGKKENLRRYGNALPPLYDLNKMTAPALLYYAPADELDSKPDVERLSKMLPNMVGFRGVNDSNFNHMDVVWGTEPDRLLYMPSIQFILNGNY